MQARLAVPQCATPGGRYRTSPWRAVCLLPLKLLRSARSVACVGILVDASVAELPVADAGPLAKKDVVIVAMRADAAAGGGESSP